MTDKRKILVTGANGQLGSELRDLSEKYPDYTFLFADRDELSITDELAVQSFFKQFTPAYCINCAAYTAVDKAEDPAQRALAHAVNAEAVRYLAKACTLYSTKLLHLSTDYVFDGNGTEPYKETDATTPTSVYGITKLEGEQEARLCSDAIIIRTAWVYSSYGKNFVKTMMKLMQERPEISVVNDQYGSPTYAADLAGAIMQIISFGKWVSGIYHYTNTGQINWHEFAVAIKEITGAKCDVKAIPAAAYPTPAKRPAWSVLDKSKIQQVYDLEIPDWNESLAICIGKINAEF